jgi:hypothetical protein
MVRRAQPKPVTAQMYRHFAVFTIAITLAVGVFADGENRQAVAGEVRAAAPKPRAGPVELIRHDSHARGSFSSDGEATGAFGQPMDLAGAAAQDGVIPGDSSAQAAPRLPSQFTQYGVPVSTWASLTPEQRKALMAKRQAEEEAAKAPERAEQISNLLAASRERSGNAEAAD